MSRTILLVTLLVLLLSLGAAAAVVSRSLQRRGRLNTRLRAVRQTDGVVNNAGGARSGYGAPGLIVLIGNAVARSGLLSTKTIGGLEHTLALIGVRGSSALGYFIGAKILLLLIAPLLTLEVIQRFEVSSLIRNLCIAGAAMAGLLGPDWWVGRRHKKYLQAILNGLPDALDLMVICAEAGLGFEPAINRVASEIYTAHPAISKEFGQTASELRIVENSAVALANLGSRTGLEGVKRMTSMLAQTMKYGTPLTDALRVLSAEMRQDMLIRFETRAARLPVLLTIPMILFILPCIFMIVGGPAYIQVMQNWHHH
jgi:tight adherence protein C